MQVFESALKLPPSSNSGSAGKTPSRVILLGNFDGFHLGHQALLKAAVAARKKGQLLTVFTFEPHPAQILLPQGDHRRIWGPIERREYLRDYPVDELIEQKFDAELASLTPEDFWRDYISILNPAVIITGEDFKFGKDRKGNSDFLRENSKSAGIDYQSLSMILQDGAKVSTSRIKEAFMDGQLKQGLEWLGHEYYLLGDVVHGARRGTDMGYPTANLRIDFKPSLKMGVYAVSSEFSGEKIYGVMNVGTTPTFTNNLKLKHEVHFFDFSGDLYGQNIKVVLHDFIRPEQKFSSLEALLEQIHTDVVKAKRIHNI